MTLLGRIGGGPVGKIEVAASSSGAWLALLIGNLWGSVVIFAVKLDKYIYLERFVE